MSQQKKKQGSNGRVLFSIAKIFLFFEFLALAACLVYIALQGVLPLKHMAILVAGAIVLLLVQNYLCKKRTKAKVFSILLSIAAIALSAGVYFGFGWIYDQYATSLGSNSEMVIYVRKDSGYETISDLKGKSFGIGETETDTKMASMTERLEEALGQTPKFVTCSGFVMQIQMLQDSDVDAIILDSNVMSSILNIVDPTFEEWAVQIPFSMEVSEEAKNSSRLNASKDSFLVYLSGLDTRDSETISDTGLSDVNMIMAVNPVTDQILMVNIPRDYYVGLYGDSDKKDKLTHAGLYGVNCSMETVESLFDVSFNYYVKVNFSSVINIVDALGGVTVDSDYAFQSAHSLSGKKYSFVEGPNTLTGDQALAFARERASFAEGDVQRGKNQQAVISAVIDKATSPSALKNFQDLLTIATENVKTNIPQKDLNSLIQMQLDEEPDWNITTMSVDGTTDNLATYSMGSQKLSVMVPDEQSIAEAKAAISQTLQTTVK